MKTNIERQQRHRAILALAGVSERDYLWANAIMRGTTAKDIKRAKQIQKQIKEARKEYVNPSL